jgi:glucose/arabinose dehydrogenase
MSLHRWGISHLVLAAAVAASSPASSQENQKSFQNDQELGRTFHVTADALPLPYDTSSVRNPAVVIPRDGAKPKVEDGFTIALFADNLEHPRQMLVLENGDVLLAEQKSGKSPSCATARVTARPMWCPCSPAISKDLTASPRFRPARIRATSSSPIPRRSGACRSSSAASGRI